jgi:hypothetical protein
VLVAEELHHRVAALRARAVGLQVIAVDRPELREGGDVVTIPRLDQLLVRLANELLVLEVGLDAAFVAGGPPAMRPEQQDETTRGRAHDP